VTFYIPSKLLDGKEEKSCWSPKLDLCDRKPCKLPAYARLVGEAD
jgi:hypothetical protein